jgi:nitrogen fixation/metabolism regulation signal transduction histidine kinase
MNPSETSSSKDRIISLLIKIVAVFSPALVAAMTANNQSSDSVYIIGAGIDVVVGIPLIIIVGLLVSYLTRKSPQSKIYSIIGFVAPSIFISLAVAQGTLFI